MRRVALLSLVAALAPAVAAARRAPPINCGGNGTQAQYCIPLRSTFSFTSTRVKAPCTLVVHYLLEPRVKGLRGRAEIRLTGSDPGNRRVRRIATPRVSGGHLTYRFRSLLSGRYALTGFYRGDQARAASPRAHLDVTLRCR